MNFAVIGIDNDKTGMINPFKSPVAITEKRLSLMQKKYINITEIRKFGSEFPINEKSLTI
jgi:hypothetical protein